MVGFVLDSTTANAGMFAIAAHATKREAHIREAEHFGWTLPEGSYGRRDRDAIVARDIRAATHLRTVEHADRMAIKPDMEIRPSNAAE